MWHEARRREKATQKLLSDQKKRADKRREENRVDPNSLLQVNGLKSKLCIEPCVYKQALKSLVAWQGNKKVTIDRFDVRATLTSIPTESESEVGRKEKGPSSRLQTVIDADESESMKRLLNYERYRLLINNDLNKISEDLRLKLVAKSDVDSDAKLRKLRNNRFGTSGEAYISAIDKVNALLGKPMQQREQPRKKGFPVGPSYNSVPPPSSFNDNKGLEGYQTEEGDIRSRALDIMAIDDFDDFELDSVKVPFVESKRVHDTAKKYSMTTEELMLLTNKDSDDVKLPTLLKELDRLNQKMKEVARHKEHYEQVYGPAPPPKLTADYVYRSESESNDSQVRQRSPSGADIPLRNGDQTRSDSFIESPDSPSLQPIGTLLLPNEEAMSLTRDPSSMMEHREPLMTCCGNASPMSASSCCSQKHLDDKQRDEVDNHVNKGLEEIPQDRSRRASTPLIYKRNCRSNRSLSRERRANHYRSSSRRSTRRRRRARSRSTSSSPVSNRYGKLSRRRRRPRAKRRRRG